MGCVLGCSGNIAGWDGGGLWLFQGLRYLDALAQELTLKNGRAGLNV